MTHLSWLIYFIGILDTAGFLFGALLGVLTLTLIPLAITYFTKELAGYNVKETERERWRNMWKQSARFLISLWIITVLLTIFTPSRQTAILIAGSEIGQTVVNSEQVQTVLNPGLDLLKIWIKNETDKIKKETIPKDNQK